MKLVKKILISIFSKKNELMKTSNFWNYPTGTNRIAISRSVPHGLEAGYRIYRTLAPGAWFRDPQYKNDQATYRERYFAEILASLNVEEEWEKLHKLAGNDEPVLLCWEALSIPATAHASPEGFAGQDRFNSLLPGCARRSSKSEAWCHLRMVADWFEQELGVDVAEYEMPKLENNQMSLL